jgi:RND family efflux transporter MFP subunit
MVVTAGGEPHVRLFPGKVEASKRVELAFQVGGPLEKLPVREGDKVAKGAVIAQLRQEDFEADLQSAKSDLDRARAALRALQSGERPEQQLRLEAQVRAAEATFANARTEFHRYELLLRRNAAARADFDRAETNMRLAREELEAARQMLEKGTTAREEDIEAKEAEVRRREAQVVKANLDLQDSTLLAPYDGEIAKRFVQLKESIRPQDPVVRFQDVDEIEVVVDVPETVMAADILTADIEKMLAEFSGAPGIQFPVHIKEVARAADPTTQTFKVRAAMKAPPDVTLLPGMTATVTVTYHRARVLGDRILVPVSAVFKESTGDSVVWAVTRDESTPDETVSRRPVKLGEATGGRIEILEGVQPGDRIAVAGASFLREGMKVRDLGDDLGGSQP